MKKKTPKSIRVRFTKEVPTRFDLATADAPPASHTVSGPKIGAKYTAFDCGDGWYVIKNVAMFSEVKKGVYDCPKDIKAPDMQVMVDKALAKFSNGEDYVAPVHKGHHKKLALTDPDFLGHFLPRRVGRQILDGKMQDVVYGDVMMNTAGFQKALRGELPHLSPEVDFDEMKFTSLAFLDSKPPYFEFPLFSIGEVIKDPSARFGKVDSEGKFAKEAPQKKAKAKAKDKPKKMEASEEDKGEEKDLETKDEAKSKEGEAEEVSGEEGDVGEKEMAEGEEGSEEFGKKGKKKGAEATDDITRVARLEAQVAKMHHHMGKMAYRAGYSYDSSIMEVDQFAKQDSSAPVEDNGKGDDEAAAGQQIEEKTQMETKFSNDPEARAAFAAQDAKIKEMEKKLSDRDAAFEKKERIAAAFEELKGVPLTDVAKADIAEFASDPNLLKRYVAAIKVQTPKDPPKNLAAFEAKALQNFTKPVDTHPDVAEFAKLGPEPMAAAQRYAMAFEFWKESKFSKHSSLRNDRKTWIEMQMLADPSGKLADDLIPASVR